jgi:yeast amino acid transporter
MFKFQFDPKYLHEFGYPDASLQWTAGVTTSPAVWVGIFLLIVLFVNLLPVRQYGRLEYIIGCSKIIFLVGIIMFNVVINARRRFHSDRFWTYERPWGFSSQNMTVRAGVPNEPDLVYYGTLGKFAATWSAMTTTLFSLMGWEIILFTAAENYDLRRTETIKLASRKIAIRVILLYTLAALTVGLNVPYSDPNLENLTINGISGGQNSVFIIAAVREHVRFLPHLLNAFFIFSGTSTAINSLYGASRVLHALSSIREVWPQWPGSESIRSRLERTRLGVPMNAVFISWLVGLLAFLSTKAAQADVSVKKLDK